MNEHNDRVWIFSFDSRSLEIMFVKENAPCSSIGFAPGSPTLFFPIKWIPFLAFLQQYHFITVSPAILAFVF